MTVESVSLNGHLSENALVYLPVNYNSQKKYPLIVFYHGDGEKGSKVTDLAKLYNNSNAGGPAYFIAHGQWPDSFYSQTDKKYYQFIVVEPQWNGWEPQNQNYTLKSICDKYSVDTSRIYLTGLSAGGWTLWGYVSHDVTTPQYKIAAIVPMSMAITPTLEEASRIVKDSIRAWGFGDIAGDVHGAHTADGIDLINKIQPGFGFFTYTKGTGHGGWGKSYNPTFRTQIDGYSLNIYEWMLLWSRNKNELTPIPVALPTSNAGSNVSIDLPTDSVVLDGSKSTSSNGTIFSYKWTEVSGPGSGVIRSSDSSKTVVSGLVQGEYVFQLVVGDSDGATDASTVSVTVNAAPNVILIADAGGDQTVILPTDSVILDGSKSISRNGSIASYKWIQVAGPEGGKIRSSTSSKTVVSGLVQGQYVFKLIVGAINGSTDSSEVEVTVNAEPPNVAPVSDAGKSQTIILPNDSAVLDGSHSVSSEDTIISYQWIQISGPEQSVINPLDSSIVVATGLVRGKYVFQLIVRDSRGLIDSSTVEVTVNELEGVGPIANAGDDQIVILPTDSVVLDGLKSASGVDSIISYLWSQVSGPKEGIIRSSDSGTTIVSSLVEGEYVFQLVVRNSAGLTDSSIIGVIVKSVTNVFPVANAGKEQTIVLPIDSVLLSEKESYDNDGDITAFKWFLKSGPSSGVIKSPDSSSTTVIDLTEGTYVFGLTVVDNRGDSATSEVKVLVLSGSPKAIVGIAPSVFAGNPVLLKAGETGYELKGDASDADGQIISVKWTQVFGPPVKITSTDSVNAQISGLLGGNVYRFRLSAIDNSGNSNYSEIVVAVNAADASKNDSIIPPKNARYQYIYIDFANTPINTDTISILGGEYTHIQFVNLEGKPKKRIVIRPLGGQVVISENNPSDNEPGWMICGNCQYFHINGLLPDNKYGFKIVGTSTNSAHWGQYFVYGKSKAFEINNVYGHSMTYGFQIKNDPNCDPSSWNTDEAKTFVIDSIDLHDFYFDSTIYEGTYIGGTLNSGDWSYGGMGGYRVVCSGDTSYHYGYRVGHVKIHDGIIKHTNNDGIQLVDARYGYTEIYNNQLYSIGGNGKSSQDHAMSLGGNIQSYIHDNYIEGAGFGFFLTGEGSITFERDTIRNSESNGWYITNSLDSPYHKIMADSMVIRLIDNVADHVDGGIVLTNYGKLLSTKTQIYGNKITNFGPREFYQPKQPDGYWQGQYGGSTLDLSAGKRPYVFITSVDTSPGSLVIHSTANNSLPKEYSVDGENWQPDSTFKNLPEGWYIASVRIDPAIRDNRNQIYITSTSTENQPPVANAGKDAVLKSPTDNFILDGSKSSDSDGEIVSYLWQQVSGPSKIGLSNSAAPLLTITGLKVGTYIFKLTVTDNLGATSSDEVKILIEQSTVDQPPVANAGTSQSITLPINNVVLDGSGSTDADGKISEYLWKQLSGPSGADIDNAGSVKAEAKGLLAGTYIFQLTVTDDKGASDSTVVNVTVSAAPVNQPPKANAGKGQSITLPVDSVVLDGSGSTDADGKISEYLWKQLSGPSGADVGNAESVKAEAKGLSAGTYIFQLTVTDDKGASDSTVVNVTVSAAPVNQPPKANAGKGQSITLPVDSVVLDGSGSTDADGKISEYLWKQTSGPSQADIVNPGSVKPVVTKLSAGTYIFQLKITDNEGAVDSSVVNVEVQPPISEGNQPPVANAGKNKSITLPVDSVVLDGSGSTDADGKISEYLWKQLSGPSGADVENAGTVKAEAKGLSAGTYIFQLTVTDGKGASDSTVVNVTVSAAPVNQPPKANAGKGQSITLPVDSVVLDGSGSSDADGEIKGYIWTQLSGPSKADIENQGSVKAHAISLSAGIYIFQLKVTDDKGASDSSVVNITVSAAPVNRPPVADAGKGQSIILPVNSVVLDGSGSTDSDGNIKGYAWKQLSGPSEASIESPGSAATQAAGLLAGIYIFQLKVTDDKGASDSTVVNVTVSAAPVNQPPVANAGKSQSITLPVDSAVLNGNGSTDVDGKINDYLWKQLSGPSSANIAEIGSVKTLVGKMSEGTYIFQLKVTDDEGASDSSVVNIYVSAAPVNQPPVANAGKDQSIILPVDSVVLNGSGSTDVDGKINDYLWKQLSGPSPANIAEIGSVKTLVRKMSAGTYIFQLKVTDDKGASDSSLIRVTVLPIPANQPPVAEAGSNQTIVLPVDSVILDGSHSSDIDGKIRDYAWKQLSGPSHAIIDEPNSMKTQANKLSPGTYVFQLRVTDDKGASDSTVVNVIVSAASLNQPPVSNAGNNISISTPLDSVYLDGSLSYDPDGSIVSYSWTQQGGSDAIIGSASNRRTVVRGLQPGTYSFQLKVSDNNGAVDSNLVQISVSSVPKHENVPPTIILKDHYTITLPVDSVFLDAGQSIDPDGKIVSYVWSKVSGPAQGRLSSVSSKSVWAKQLVEGSYIYRLTVSDNNNGVSSLTIIITVLPEIVNQLPVADAGKSKTVRIPLDSALLAGSASYDPDGKIVNYLWTQKSGPRKYHIASPDSAITLVDDLIPGTYVFQLMVTDDRGAQSSDSVVIEVLAPLNQPPVADAGSDIVITLPQDTAMLSASNSYDPDGTIVSYSWERMTGPDNGLLVNPNSEFCRVVGLETGTYDFNLTVTDNKGAQSMAQVSIFVNPVKDTMETNFTVYPNPVQNILHVDINKAVTGLLKFRIVDVNGRIVKLFNYGSLPSHVTTTLDVSSLTAGIYFIQLIEDNQLRDSRKIIKY